MRLKDKVAVITGGAMGMGKGTAEVFAKEGAKVILIDFSKDLIKTQEELKENDFLVETFQVDVRDKEKLKEIYQNIFDKYGHLDILVNAAGIGTQASFFNADGKILSDMMDINFGGIWNSCQAAIPFMLKNNYGKVINFASVTGVMVVDPSMTAYAASKGAIMALTKALAVEFAPKNITVNAILPGMINTPMTQKSSKEANPSDPQKILDGLAKTVPMGRLGTAEEAGKVALFLATEDSSYVTGSAIVFDGGSTLPESPGSGWQPEDE
ncbi:glucose 1-dehydrogenase [Vagococcus elongatus]|uniref:Short-chain dehydrogenase n=1 Tax=Vagococcus elongatus TaxID=180344 RepID=A0A430B5A8_9ENTE|nr:glucose 1-dehydrogenase [Vagococcus elongatus]RSU15524.1 hypothetical protein CBF29_00140 [Vagococcus elongatus]